MITLIEWGAVAGALLAVLALAGAILAGFRHVLRLELTPIEERMTAIEERQIGIVAVMTQQGFRPIRGFKEAPHEHSG
ncbi:MAG: hypothetical protein Q8P38_05570 [Candidatus Nanopelagicales bacterium]|nr:hypothetical protein [Candidatus Nanopelagicales bacterium]